MHVTNSLVTTDDDDDDDDDDTVCTALVLLWSLWLYCVVVLGVFVKAVYPKSDEQRRRLNDAVKHILLFRSLEEVLIQHSLSPSLCLSVSMCLSVSFSHHGSCIWLSEEKSYLSSLVQS